MKEYKTSESTRKAIYRYLHLHQEKRMFGTAKQRAKKQGIEFSIIEQDIKIPEFCPLLGIRLTNTFGEGRVQSNASLDRIDSSKGYTKENIQIISDLANRMKQEATPEQLICFANNILKTITITKNIINN